MKILLIILLSLLVGLQYRLWLGKGSYEEFNSLQQTLEQQRQENAALSLRNKGLAAEIIDLKQGLEAVEERARLEFGMIKAGEVFYQIVE